MKVQARITNNGPVGGFTAEIKRNGEWIRINKWLGGGVVSFDSRDQALKAIRLKASVIATAT